MLDVSGGLLLTPDRHTQAAVYMSGRGEYTYHRRRGSSDRSYSTEKRASIAQAQRFPQRCCASPVATATAVSGAHQPRGRAAPVGPLLRVALASSPWG